MNLVIVESPAKAKTIEKYLGGDYKVIASVGHIIDLPKKELGVDVDNNFEPKYTVIEGKQKVIDGLKKLAKNADIVYLAPDPDREGEAIAWHISTQLKNKNIKRVLFNEITKKGVLEGINNPSSINMNRVNAQQSRRILDRLVGYLISPLLWRPLKSGLSAGRVQSVAVRLLCEREEDIEKFVPVESWSVEAEFDIKGEKKSESGKLKAKLDKIKGKKADIKNEEEALKVLATLPNDFKVISVDRKEVKQTPQNAFITSRLQQEAIRKLSFTSKKVMSIAQQLYEGIEIGADGSVGLITYMRTDSTRIAPDAAEECEKCIETTYGKEYLPKSKRAAKKAAPNVQDAHEAIRPTNVNYNPKDIEKFLTRDQFRLYKLIWERFVASLMSDAIFNQTTVNIEGNEYIFKTSAKVLKFAGFSVLYLESTDEDGGDGETDEDKPIKFDIIEGSPATILTPTKKQHFTTPPFRFTESTLVKTLEQKGIGRPSTYAAIISTIIDRKYAELADKKFHPTELGRIVNNLLITNFPKIFEVKFTADMEKELDLVDNGSLDWKNLLSVFYKDLDIELKAASTGKLASSLKTDIKCPTCSDGDLVIKNGKNGAFAACSKYPECSFTSDFKRDEDGKVILVEATKNVGVGKNCEKCGAELVIKKSRFGDIVACPNYPECKNIKNYLKRPDGSIRIFDSNETLNAACPKCSKPLVIKAGRNGIFVACSGYPDCKYTANLTLNEDDSLGVTEKRKDSTDEVCEKCGKPMAVKRFKGKPFLACTGYPECKTTKQYKD